MKHIKEYDNFLFENQENVILYHGSKNKFDEFDDTMVSKGEGGDLFGKGFYLTNNIEVAKFYAYQVSKKDHVDRYTNTGIFGTPEPIYKPDADEKAKKSATVNKFRVHGKILDAADYIIDDKFKEFIIETYAKEAGYKKEQAVAEGERVFDFLRNNKEKIHNYRGELEYVVKQLGYIGPEVVQPIIDYIKDTLKYDGIKYESDKSYEGKGSWNYVIFNKKAISPVN